MNGSTEPAEHEPKPGASRLSGRGRFGGRGLALYLLAVIVVGIIGIAVAIGAFHRAFTAPGPLTVERNVVVPRGASIGAIGDLLAAHGVIADAAVFRYGVPVFGGDQPLRAGEYAFAPQSSAQDAMQVLQSGKTVIRRLTIPEGLTNAQIYALIDGATGLSGPLPPPDSLDEGQLLPETYQYSWGDTRAAVLARMAKAMTDALAALWLARAENLPLRTPAEALVLASIVERETALAAERPRVAGVFVNRLRRGMRLQSDPTVVYGLSAGSGSIERPLSRADLRSDHPYNTYLYDGLPPGPIANPGRASIAAVLNPVNSEELYFVADGEGGHAFARTLKEHNRNVAKWRKLERNNKQ